MEFWREASNIKLNNSSDFASTIYIKFYESGCWEAYIQSEWMKTQGIRVYLPNSTFEARIVGSFLSDDLSGDLSGDIARTHHAGIQKIIYGKIDPLDDQWQIPVVYDWSELKIRRSMQ